MPIKFRYNEGVKVKSILFFIYFFISIAALCALLIFAPSLKSEDNSNFEIIYTETNNDNSSLTDKENNKEAQDDNKSESDVEDDAGNDNQSTENNNTNENNTKDDNTNESNAEGENADKSENNIKDNISEFQFATSMIVNLPKTITVYVDSELILGSECVTIQPKEMKDLVRIEILPVYNSDVNKVQRDDLVFKFVECGTYKLNFSVPSKSGALEKNVKLVVKDKKNAKIQQIVSTLFLNQKIEVNQIFKSDNLSNLQFKSSDVVIENNQIISPQHESSNAVIYAYEKDNYYQIAYKFNFVVKQLPEYEIELEGVNDTISVDHKNNKYLTLYYVVSNREDTNVSQLVVAEIDNKEIATVESVGVSAIIICLNGCGEANLKVSLIEDRNVVKHLRINVLN